MVIPVKRLDLRDPMTPEQRKKKIAQILGNCIVTEKGCIEWQKWRNWKGYGETSCQAKNWLVHRLMWVLVKGPLPPKLYVCHRCDNPSCCNPEHLFLGDHLANQQDKHRKGRCPQKAKTHCKQGHPYSGDNLYLDKRGFRGCKTCQRIRLRLKAGWTKEQAESLPVTLHGFQPVKAKWHWMDK